MTLDKRPADWWLHASRIDAAVLREREGDYVYNYPCLSAYGDITAMLGQHISVGASFC